MKSEPAAASSKIMSDSPETPKPARRRFGWILTLLVCICILGGAGAATVLIFRTEPEAQRTASTRETAMLVDVTEVRRGSYRPQLSVLGTVQPAQDIILSPRVSGQIIERSPSFTPGGFVKKNEMLLRIDPADYENALRQRESALQRAIAELDIEMGRQNAARQGFDLLDESLAVENKSLVLREPQVDTARAEVEAARAALDQAELDLNRTRIEAPFDAHVLRRDVNLGSQVSAGSDLGRLVGIDEYWVEATVPLSKLHWLSFAEQQDSEGSLVQIRNRSSWPEGVHREGRLYRLIGALEERTRLARVLVTVKDPLLHENPSSDLPKMMIGSYVEAIIQVRELKDVVRLSRDYVRKNDTVWLMKDGRLQIRDVRIRFTDPKNAYISEGLENGDQVVMTNLATVVEGARLRLEGGDGGTKGEADGQAAEEPAMEEGA